MKNIVVYLVAVLVFVTLVNSQIIIGENNTGLFESPWEIHDYEISFVADDVVFLKVYHYANWIARVQFLSESGILLNEAYTDGYGYGESTSFLQQIVDTGSYVVRISVHSHYPNVNFFYNIYAQTLNSPQNIQTLVLGDTDVNEYEFFGAVSDYTISIPSDFSFLLDFVYSVNSVSFMELFDCNGIPIGESNYYGGNPQTADLYAYIEDAGDYVLLLTQAGVTSGNFNYQISALGLVDIFGCTSDLADNYNPMANIDDGSCLIPGCTYFNSPNYNPDATYDDGTCDFIDGDMNGDSILDILDVVILVNEILAE